ncbi:MAG: hypothetical protein LBU89_11850 [Fibromonadaceae bacterium]|nr:hypothetical protein [Fibromonadaceae bacterium]
MLAATTASIIVFRIISSENVSSGARLKMSESEAAANSGLEAVQAWLTNKAPDAGVLLSDYLSPANASGGQPRPILVDNNLLGSVGGSKSQNYSVYLVGADVSSKPFKMKFVSVGTARDNSKSNQVAVFGVDGLFRVSIPTKLSTSGFDQAFFGVAGDLTDGTEFNSAIINQSVGGNMPSITEHLIVAGDATFQGGTAATCSEKNSGALYIVGNLKPEGSLRVCGNAYVGSLELTSGTTGTFEQDLYINNGSNKTLGQNLTVNKNLTMRTGALTIGQTAAISIGSDFSMMENSASISFSDSRNFTVAGTSWIPGGNITVNDQNNSVILNNTAGRSLYVAGVTSAGENGGYNLYRRGTTGRTFRSRGLNAPSIPETIPNTIDTASNLYNEVGWRLEDGGGKIEDPIKAMNVEEWIKRAIDMPAKCAGITGLENKIINWGSNAVGNNAAGFINDLNTCYANLSENDLYSGYFPIIINNNQDRNFGDFTLTGNYFFIFIGGTGFTFPRTGINSKTGEDAYVMAYFLDNSRPVTHGGVTVNGPAANSAQGQLKFPSGHRPKLFIFSERDLSEINNAQFDGSLFMANGRSANKFQGGVKIEFNLELYLSLVTAGILELTEAGKKLAEDDGETQDVTKIDHRYTALAPRLKVTLESRHIGHLDATELEKLNPANNLKPAVLVMPRIVYLPKDADMATGLNPYYSVLFLNGLVEPARTGDWRANRGTTSCKNLSSGYDATWTSPLTEGDYACEFRRAATPSALIDTFFVRIGGELGSARIGFAGSSANISDDTPMEGAVRCATVGLKYDPGKDPNLVCNVSIKSELADGWTVNNNTAPNLTGISVSNTQPYSFKVCVSETATASSVNFSLENLGSCMPGQDQVFTVNREGNIIATITRERNNTDNNVSSRPDCPGIGLGANPARNAAAVAWGPFQIHSTAVCKLEDNVYRYSCSAANQYDVSLRAAPGLSLGADSECEFLPSNPTTPIQIANDQDVRIQADIKRKNYTLIVTNPNNLTLVFRPGTPVCLNLNNDCVEGNFLPDATCSSNNCSVTLYAGVTYGVGISSNTLVSEGADLSANFNMTGREGTLAVTNFGNRNTRFLTLSNYVPPSISCAVINGSEILAGAGLLSAEEVEAKLMIPGATVINNNMNRCVNPKYSYKVTGTTASGTAVNQTLTSPWNPVVGTGYKVSIAATCDDLSANVEEAECSGSFNVVDQKDPVITCEWGRVGNYYTGEIPSVDVTVTNGSTVTCGLPTATSTFTGLTSSWSRNHSNANSTLGASTDYIITANASLSTVETERSVTVSANCGGTNYSATCSGKGVLSLGSCSYSPNFCKGISYGDVIKNQNFNIIGWDDTNHPERCIFATSIENMGNHQGGSNNPLLVNGQVLPGKSTNSSRGRCGGEGQDWQNQDLLPCSEALASIPKVDGGYYIYAPPGWVNQNFVVTGGVPDCDGNGNGGNGGEGCNPPPNCASATTNISNRWPNQNECVFYKNLTEENNSFGFSTEDGGNICINGICKAGGGAWGGLNTLPLPIDGGYYVYRAATHLYWSAGTRTAGSPDCGGDSSDECSDSNSALLVGTPNQCNSDNGYENHRTNWVEPNVSVGSCYKYNCQGSLRIGSWAGAKKVSVKSAIGFNCNQEVSIGADSQVENICAPSGDVFIKVLEGSGAMQIACNNHTPCQGLVCLNPVNMNPADACPSTNDNRSSQFNTSIPENSCFTYNCQGNFQIRNQGGSEIRIQTSGCSNGDNTDLGIPSGTNTSWTNVCNANGNVVVRVRGGSANRLGTSNNVVFRCANHVPCQQLTCGNVPSAGTANIPITPPTVQCGNTNVTSGVTWSSNMGSGTPNWTSPVQNTYSSITATANCGGSNKTASCSGTLTVGAAPVITITEQPAENTTVTAGNTVTLTCAAEVTGSGTVNYEWYNTTTAGCNNTSQTNLSVGTGPSYTIPNNLTSGMTHCYYCRVRATGAQSVSSEVARVTVNAGGGGTAVCSGSETTFTAGTHTVTVASSCTGSQILCYGNDNVSKTVTFNGVLKSGDALRYGNDGWVENWGLGNKPVTATLTVSAGTVMCRTDW